MAPIPRVCTACSWLMVAWIPGVVAAGETKPVDVGSLTAEERELFNEFRHNYHRLPEFYGNAKIEAIWRRDAYPSELPRYVSEPPPSAWRLVYRSRTNRWFRMDETALYGDGQDEGTTKFRLVRSEGYIVAERRASTGPSLLTGISANCAEGRGDISTYRFPRAPFSRDVLPLEFQLLSTPRHASRVVLESISTHEEEGEALVTICANQFVPKLADPWPMRFTFLKDRSWAVKEYDCGREGRAQLRATLTYAGNYNGIPLLKRVEYWERMPPRDGHEQAAWRHEVFDITSFVVGAVPEEEFRPEAIGLTIGSQRRRWPTRLALAIAGVLLVVVYTLLRRRSVSEQPEAS